MTVITGSADSPGPHIDFSFTVSCVPFTSTNDQCGHIVWIDFDPQSGHEQAGRRPAFVISPTAYNEKIGLALLCPIASQVKGYPFEVAIPKGLSVSGVILADQIKSLDWRSREAEFGCDAPQETVDLVLEKLSTLLS